MSWIERPERNLVGEFDLSTLKIDEAFFNVSSSANSKLWLYELSTACFSCPYKLVNKTEVGEAFNKVTVDTLFPIKYRLRTNANAFVPEDQDDPFKFCDIDHNFGEFGVYNLHASGSLEAPKCNLTVPGEPVNIYLPLLLAFFFYVLLIGAYKLIGLWRRRSNNRRELSSTTHPTQPSPTSASSILSSNGVPNGNKAADSGTAENGGPRNQAQVTATPSSSPSSQKQKQRLRSLDTFRGLCIMIMIFVNDGGARYYFFEHAIWDGLYVADLVFPWFLWIMGVAIPIAIKSQVKRGTPKMKIFKSIAIRSIKLICLGVMHNSLFGPINFGEQANLRIPGVLQRFGVCYFICSSLILFTMDFNFSKPGASKLKAAIQDVGILWVSWIPILVIVLIHTLITFLLKVPGCPDGYLGPGGLHNNNAVNGSCIGGASGYVDQKIFTNKHLYQWPTTKAIYDSGSYDPEGFLGTLTAILQVWLGVQTGATMLVFPRGSSRLKRWGIWAIITGGIAALLCQAKETGGWIPVNKNLWSLSFVLVTSSFALILLSVLYIIIDIKQWWKGSPFFEPGMNSILLYVGHSTFTSSLPWHWSDGFMRTHFVRLVEALWGTSLWALIAIWLHRKKTYWKV